MRLREQRLWDSLRNNIRRDVKLERVENGLGAGMPDVLGIFESMVFWIELKAIDAWPVRDSTPALGNEDGLNVDQRNWLLDWYNREGTAMVLIGVGRGKTRELFLVPGEHADEINYMTRSNLQSFRVTWAQINTLLGVL